MLKIDGHGYSPTILHRILHLAGVTSSFDVAEVALKVVGEITISDRQINKLVSEVGEERRWIVLSHSPIRGATVTAAADGAESPPDFAAVFGDGGRMRTREPDQGRGVHQPHWARRRTRRFIGCRAALRRRPASGVARLFPQSSVCGKAGKRSEMPKNETFQEASGAEPRRRPVAKPRRRQISNRRRGNRGGFARPEFVDRQR